jgi:hypothetical protein
MIPFFVVPALPVIGGTFRRRNSNTGDTMKSQNSVQVRSAKKGLTIKSGVKSGGFALNHNQIVRAGLPIKSSIKAGGFSVNHNPTLRAGLPIKSSVKSGGMMLNHNQTLMAY